jgi:aspartate dehydrogenase
MDAFGLIGFGGIGHAVLEALTDQMSTEPPLTGILVRTLEIQSANIPFIVDIYGFLERRPRLVVECAGHQAVRNYGEKVLSSGADLIVASTGALADPELLASLRLAARDAGSRLIIPAGAVGGIDALRAARLAGLASVRYRGRKPPMAWQGSTATDGIDLAGLEEPTVIYRGTAREAALAFPKNSNVAATVTLAGLGFDETEVELIADPTVGGNVHEIDVRASTGDFSIALTGKPSASNPRTSMLTAYSIVRTLLNLDEAVVI